MCLGFGSEGRSFRKGGNHQFSGCQSRLAFVEDKGNSWSLDEFSASDAQV